VCGDIPFWKKKELAKMSPDEWEALCDGCAKCCLHKIEDEADNSIFYTNVVCDQLNANSCRCKNYHERTTLVVDCIKITKDNLSNLNWLPKSCAYRLLSEGKDLLWWHPLVSGDPNTVHSAGISIKKRCVVETEVIDIENHIVTWPNED